MEPISLSSIQNQLPSPKIQNQKLLSNEIIKKKNTPSQLKQLSGLISRIKKYIQQINQMKPWHMSVQLAFKDLNTLYRVSSL